jgi:hypothetical protein
MTAYNQLKALNELFTIRRNATDCQTAFDCLIHIADGDGNATDTLGWDARDTEEWCSLVIRTIECSLETAEPHVRAAFNALGYSH